MGYDFIMMLVPFLVQPLCLTVSCPAHRWIDAGGPKDHDPVDDAGQSGAPSRRSRLQRRELT